MYILTILVVVVLVGFAISGLDDLAIDTIYWTKRLGNRSDRGRKLTREGLDDRPELPVAVLTAAWHEYDVVAHMLRFNAARVEYSHCDFFVGTYPNDPETQAAVDQAASELHNVFKAVNSRPGPTSKADCLNAAVAEMRRHEEANGIRYAFVVLHDPEDVLHPLEFKLYNRIFSSRREIDMVQTPIYPFAARTRDFTAGAYMDEFAEQHTKNLYAREWAETFIPSAGVATALRRETLDRISEGAEPFGVHSLTEDYEIGLKVAVHGMKAVFVRQLIAITDDRGIVTHDVIATQANFPHTFATAVRQRTRWTLGIVFQAREQWGWVGSWRMRWMLAHDRKGPWSYVVVFAGYLFMLYVVAYTLIQWLAYPEWDAPIPGGVALRWAFAFSLFMMVQRMAQRVISTTRVYGGRHGLLSVMRHPWGTLINLVATFRALGQFRRSQRYDTALTWDKTQHFVPHEVSRHIA